MKRPCDACGQPYEAKTKRSHYCSRTPCKRKRARARKRKSDNVVPFPEKAPDPGAEPTPFGPGRVTDATRAELELAGKLDTSVGQAAMALARRLDSPDDDTGSSQAAVAKQLQALMADVLKGMKVKDDPLDELRARRERRLSGA